MSHEGQTVRVPLSTIRVTSRVTQGVILAKLKDPKDAFTTVVVTLKSEDEEINEEEENE